MAETLSAKTSQALGITDPIKDLTTKRDTAVQEELGAGAAVQALETRKAESEAKRTSEQAKEKVKSTEELTQRQAEREAPIREQKSVIDKALMDEHFAPSKQNLQDQAALFSLINVIGFAIGTGGKQNAMMAMHAMNGMLEGHQKGRADLFKEEQVKFDKNFKALQQKATFLETELRHSLEEFTRDKRAADERASAAFASAGADFMKIYADKNGLVAAYERAKEVRKSLDKAIEGERLRKERVEDKAASDAQRAEDQRKLQQQRQEDRIAAGKELRQFGASLKTPAAGSKATKGSQSQQQFENITSADIGNAYFRINEYLADSKDGKIPEGSKFLRDKGTQSGIIDAFKNYLVNATLPADLQKNDATLLGIAFDVVAARAFGRASGVTDSKIAQVVRQLPVQGDNESTKQAKMRILLNQLEEPNKLLPEEKRKDGATYMKSPVARGLYRTYSEKLDTGEMKETEGLEDTSSGETSYMNQSEIDTVRKNAKAALSAGAPENLVKERFRKLTGQEL
jgi:hypothetical protein